MKVQFRIPVRLAAAEPGVRRLTLPRPQNSLIDEPSVTWKFQLTAVGDEFRPSKTALDLADAFDVGTIRKTGIHKDHPSPFGMASFALPTSSDPRSQLLEFCSRALDAKEVLRAAGATDFEVWILREYENQCNEEFSPAELAALVKLDCTLCYSAWDTAKGNSTEPTATRTAERRGRPIAAEPSVAADVRPR